MISRRAFVGSVLGMGGLLGSALSAGRRWIPPRSAADVEADDQPAIQELLDEAQPGAVITLPRGVYNFGRRVIWPAEKPLTLACDVGALFRQSTGSNDYLFLFPAGCRDSRITGATFLGSGNRKQAVVIFSANHGSRPARNLLFDRIRVSTWDGEVFLLAANGASGGIGSVPRSITIRECTMEDLGEAALAVFAGRDIMFQDNCCIVGHRTPGSGGNAVVHPLHFSYDRAEQPDPLLVSRGVMVTGNTLVCKDREFGGHAISLDNNTRRFDPEGVGEFVIADNVIRGPFSTGLRAVFSDAHDVSLAAPSGILIENNIVSGVERSGIYLRGGVAHRIEDNQILHFGQDGAGDHGGIRLQDVRRTTVIRNRLLSATDRYGVRILNRGEPAGGSDNVIQNNSIAVSTSRGRME